MDRNFVLTVDGVRHEVRCGEEAPLVHVLRNDLGRYGTRFGCGEGLCGVCFVLVDGHPVPSCTTPVWAADGREVTTVEGLGAEGERLRAAFAAEQAAQCGFCLSGLLVSAAALLRERAPGDGPTGAEGDGDAVAEADARAVLDRHLCRCGTHTRILRAVVRAADRAVPTVGTAPGSREPAP